MKEIIDWLQHVEQLAYEVYQAASNQFNQDRVFSSFLSKLGQDESLHFDLMRSAAQYLQETKEPPVSAITIDSSTRDNVKIPLLHLHNNLMMGQTITKQDVVDCIVKVEFSEWNDIFLFVISTFQEYAKTFQHLAAAIQAHKKRIEEFLEDLSDDLKISRDIRTLPRIWKEKLLIVEDETPIRELIAKVLGRQGAIETATNGREALDKTKENFFNAVISDIDMPVMSGLEFYQKAVEMDPEIGRRFVFCSGEVTSELEAFCRKHDLVYLKKPFSLQQLIQVVQDITDKTL